MQLVEALSYKPEGRGFDSRWCRWNFSLTNSFRPRYGRRVDSVSNRNEYRVGKGGRCVGLTTLPPSCAGCLKIWEPQPPGTLRACPDLYRDRFTFYLATSFDPECGPSLGHYTRTRKYTETICTVRLEVSLLYIKNTL